MLSKTRSALSEGTLSGGRWARISFVHTDLFFVFANALFVLYFRFAPNPLTEFFLGPESEPPRTAPPLEEHLGFLLLYSVLVILSCHSQELYSAVRARSALDEAFAVFKAVVLATLVLIAFIYLSNIKIISRLVVGTSAVLNVVTLAAWRLWVRRRIERRVAEGHGARNVLIVGSGKAARELLHYFEGNKQLGYVVKGFLDDNDTSPQSLGRVDDLRRVALAHFIDEVFITNPWDREMVRTVVREAMQNGVDVKVVPDFSEHLAWPTQIEYLGDFPVMSLYRKSLPAFGLFVKRTADALAAAVALAVLSPLLILIAGAIKLHSPGPVFYPSRRVGKKGRLFTCYKFRTMVANADALKDGLRALNERRGPMFKITNDPRLTRPGRFFRKYSLDELPQLWNVLKGDMSLVGPRPPLPDEFETYRLEYMRRLQVTPGITGLWQVSARRDPSFEKAVSLDLEYIANWNLWLDLQILLRTLPVVFRGSGQ